MMILKVITLAAMMACKSDADKVSVNFNTTETSSYCGGVEPDEETLNKLRTPVPKVIDLYVYNANGKSKMITVKHGSTIKLSTGKYVISPNGKLSKTDIENILTKRGQMITAENPGLNASVFEIDAKKGNQTISYNYHNFCAHELHPDVEPPPSAQPKD